MGRTVYWMNVSMDLRIEHGEGEQGEGSWLSIGEELHREFNARARALSLMVQGRVVYEIMESFWPSARQDPSLPDYMREYGEIWTNAAKVLVSRTRSSAGHNTRVVGADGDAVSQLSQIRAETKGDIGVGGATIATQLLKEGVLDELLLFVHPVVLGSGRPLFDELSLPLGCTLVESKVFERGVVMLRYTLPTA